MEEILIKNREDISKAKRIGTINSTILYLIDIII